MLNIKYPKICLKSKNELCKRLSHKRLPPSKMLELINDCLKNKDNYWKDHLAMSEPDKGKYVRNTSGTKLSKLLRLIDGQLLKRYDELLPEYIFGGVQKKNNVTAAKNLLGSRRKRTLLKLDLINFFEQVPKHRVESFFILKTECTPRVARILGSLCCVSLGKKGSDDKMVLARGFSTSSRLAIWTNINLFEKMKELVFHELRGKNPHIVVFVDDIGISATNVTKKELVTLRNKIDTLFKSFDDNHQLELHPIDSKKGCNITHHYEGMEFVGVGLLRNSLSPGKKASAKRHRLKQEVSKSSENQKKQLKKQYNGTQRYKKYVETI